MPAPAAGGADADAAPVRVLCGPAGWSYADWDGIVYPAPRPPGYRPLDELLALFPVLEVNVSFYRDVPARQVAAWCERTAGRPDFRWCFKLPRRLSHGESLPPPAALLAACRPFAPAREAGQLGALLLQFPWSLRASPAARAALAELDRAARDAGWPLVIEVRHAGWEPPLGFTPVVPDQPALRGNLEADRALAAALAAPLALRPLYLRLHGRNGAAWFDPAAGRDARYDYLYGEREIAEWARRLRVAASRLPAGTSIFVIMNNHFRGQAVVNALQLQRLWSGQTPALPAGLRRAYPRELDPFPAAPAPAPGPSRPRRPPRRDGGEPTLF